MTYRCAILDDYQGVALTMADWSPLAGRVELRTCREHMADEDELVEAIADCELLVIMRERTPFPERVFARLPRLRLLVTTGMRNASVDLEAAARHGVTVCGTGGGGEGTAELTWALLLGLARHVAVESGSLREGGRWQSTVGADLSGARLGVLGLGRIGTRVARVGRAFGMDVAAWSPNLTQERADAAGVRLAASKEQLLAESDFVTIHLVLGERTRGLIGAEELMRMRPSAYLINMSRGPIVDEAALVEALQEKRIAGAGLDVYDREPLPAGHPFRSLPNALCTPHIGYVTTDSYRAFFGGAAAAVAAYLDGEPINVLARPGGGQS